MDESDPAAAPKTPRAQGARTTNGPSAPGATPIEAASNAADRRESAPGVDEDGASLEAERVELRMSAVGRVEADQVSVGNGAVGAVRADVLTVDRGFVGAAMADTIEISQGYARSIIGRQVQLERSAARVVIAADVQAKQSAALFLVARRVNGDLRVLLDWRGAVAFGAVAGLVMGILSRLRRRAR